MPRLRRDREVVQAHAAAAVRQVLCARSGAVKDHPRQVAGALALAGPRGALAGADAVMRVLLYVHRLTHADLSRNNRAAPTASNLASEGGVKYARLSAYTARSAEVGRKLPLRTRPSESQSTTSCQNHATTGAKRCATEGVAMSVTEPSGIVAVPRPYFFRNAACFNAACFLRSAAASSRATLSPPRDPPIH